MSHTSFLRKKTKKCSDLYPGKYGNHFCILAISVMRLCLLYFIVINPVPKVIMATKYGVCVAESENIQNTSVTLATKSVVAISYMSQDEVYYWVTKEKILEEFAPSANKKVIRGK